MDDTLDLNQNEQYPNFNPEEYPDVPTNVVELFNGRLVYSAKVLTFHGENGPYKQVWVRYLERPWVESLDSGKSKTIDDFMDAKRSMDKNRFSDRAFFYPEEKGYFMIDGVTVKVKVAVVEVTDDIRRIAEAYEDNLASLYAPRSLRQLGVAFFMDLLSFLEGGEG